MRRRVLCPTCAVALTIHQPDLRDPDRLLGTCRRCRAWHLVVGGGAVLTISTPRRPRAEALPEPG